MENIKVKRSSYRPAVYRFLGKCRSKERNMDHRKTFVFTEEYNPRYILCSKLLQMITIFSTIQDSVQNLKHFYRHDISGSAGQTVDWLSNNFFQKQIL